MLEVSLLLSAGLVVFHFAIYPLIVWSLAGRRRFRAEPTTGQGGGGTELSADWGGSRAAPPDEPAELPPVSLIVAAYNEQQVIASKIANSLALDYPADRLQIIVVSDGSDDRTHEIASSYVELGVVAMHEPQRRGKSAALNRAVERAHGEIVVFSDANNDFSRGALRALVRHFQDPAVGGVCGRKCIRPADDRESSVGDSLYWRYESAIKIAESDLGIMTTADGEIFAIRRRLYEPIPPHVINDDAEITFAMVRAGVRIVYEPEALSTEMASLRLEEDFRVKVRMIAGGFQSVQQHWRVLVPPRSAFAWAFLSHKLLRWCIPLLLAVVLGCSLALWRQPAVAVLLAAQVALYGLGLLGWVTRNRPRLPAWKYVPLYFGLMNIAALVGLRRFLAGDGITSIWHKAAR